MQTEKVCEFIVDWLIDYSRHAGTKGFVVGVSGGIDSAVTSTLCARTGMQVLAVDMPIYQPQSQMELSARHIAWLEASFTQVQGVRVDLTSAFQAVENTLPRDIQDDLTMANTRSRLRMLTLYAFAAHHGMLVPGTGNKIEDFGVGFFTKYGDGGVDIAPIADLMKSEVYALGRHLGVVQEIMDVPPTDGLWADSRSDQDQLGASYTELEQAMQFAEQGGDPSFLSDREREVLDIYTKLHAKNRHKMEPIPVAVIPGHLR
ncbi:NAD(+) synthase [Desulfovermiculus halophilus]|jgi:NAD+ synthase|uniref:NAD(+) synthase n=1 Tax=Desulfovermiculus halophilus TaxID=339722 RepID=UPI000480C6F9|nr:NAD(+) synthase [Desulfovermiculus halophilus]